MAEWKDVTDKVHFGDNDGELLPLSTCVCGAEFQLWKQVLGVYQDNPWTCPVCGVKLCFRLSIQVMQQIG